MGRTDKSMKTWIQLSRAFYKISTKELAYFKSHNLTLNQFKVLEVLYHRGDLNVSSITKKGIDIIENIFPQHAQNLHDNLSVLDDDELDTLITLLRKLGKAQ